MIFRTIAIAAVMLTGCSSEDKVTNADGSQKVSSAQTEIPLPPPISTSTEIPENIRQKIKESEDRAKTLEYTPDNSNKTTTRMSNQEFENAMKLPPAKTK